MSNNMFLSFNGDRKMDDAIGHLWIEGESQKIALLRVQRIWDINNIN